MIGPKRTARKGQKRGTPLTSVLEAVEERRDAKADAAALDAALAAGKRLRPPPTRIAERPPRRDGEPAPAWVWDGADDASGDGE